MKYNLKHYAYIGDAVWEMFIRELVINKTQKQDSAPARWLVECQA